MKKGFSLVEIMVAMSLFAILSVSVTLISAGILRTALRSAVTNKVRSEGSYAMAAMSLVTRYSVQAICDTSATWMDVSQKPGSPPVRYKCVVGVPGNITSNTAPLVSNEVNISACSFICSGNTVRIQFNATDVNGLMVTPLTFDSQIVLRNK